MKYEFIRVDEDTTTLKYKDKEFTFRSNVKLISEMQSLVMQSRMKMIQDLAKNGQSVKDLTIEIKKDGKTYYDNSNKEELEKMYQEQITLEYFNNKCSEIFGMDLGTLMLDIGLKTEQEGVKFSNEFLSYLSGSTPRE